MLSPARLVAALTLLAVASPAAAHDEPQAPLRELVRIQGHRAAAPAGAKVERQLTLTVLGEPLPFAASEWRSFAFHDPAVGAKLPAEPPGYTLQGDRPLLRRISTARPDQQVTILAERRTGMSDLFVLAVDRCPPE